MMSRIATLACVVCAISSSGQAVAQGANNSVVNSSTVPAAGTIRYDGKAVLAPGNTVDTIRFSYRIQGAAFWTAVTPPNGWTCDPVTGLFSSAFDINVPKGTYEVKIFATFNGGGTPSASSTVILVVN
jgi:hypothetical protein